MVEFPLNRDYSGLWHLWCRHKRTFARFQQHCPEGDTATKQIVNEMVGIINYYRADGIYIVTVRQIRNRHKMEKLLSINCAQINSCSYFLPQSDMRALKVPILFSCLHKGWNALNSTKCLYCLPYTARITVGTTYTSFINWSSFYCIIPLNHQKLADRI